MKVLLVGINFGNYEKRIVKMLQSQGHNVFYMYDTDEKYSFYLKVFGKSYTKKKTVQYQNTMLKKMPNSFDRVIVIVGRQLTNEFLDAVKRNNPKAHYILYLWDDINRVENFWEIKHYFDDIYSFDLKDCRDYGFKHLPLFFSQRPFDKTVKEFDIYSAMFSHSEREKIIYAVAKQADTLNQKYRFYISLGHFVYFKRRNEIKENRNADIVYISKPIDENKNYAYMNRAKAILDVQFSSQIGLTMRTIESLGMKNKLITTNPSVRYYDFYNENNVFVLDRKSPSVSSEFLKLPYCEIPKEIYEKYSLDTWVKTLTGEIELNNYLGKQSWLRTQI